MSRSGQPGRSRLVQDPLARRHHASGDVAAGVHAAAGCAGAQATTAPGSLPWCAGPSFTTSAKLRALVVPQGPEAPAPATPPAERKAICAHQPAARRRKQLDHPDRHSSVSLRNNRGGSSRGATIRASSPCEFHQSCMSGSPSPRRPKARHQHAGSRSTRAARRRLMPGRSLKRSANSGTPILRQPCAVHACQPKPAALPSQPAHLNR